MRCRKNIIVLQEYKWFYSQDSVWQDRQLIMSFLTHNKRGVGPSQEAHNQMDAILHITQRCLQPKPHLTHSQQNCLKGHHHQNLKRWGLPFSKSSASFIWRKGKRVRRGPSLTDKKKISALPTNPRGGARSMGEQHGDIHPWDCERSGCEGP